MILQNNCILFPKLFRLVVRKNRSSDQEKLLKFEAEGPSISKHFYITRAIVSNSKSSVQFLKKNTF